MKYSLSSVWVPIGNTALTYACCGGYEDVVQLLLEASAFVEEQNENGHTPLMEAASGGHIGKGVCLSDTEHILSVRKMILHNRIMR